MGKKTWLRIGDQVAGNLRSSQATYLLSVVILTAIITVGDINPDSDFLLTVSAIGLGLFGLLTFENSQQGFIGLMKSMPEDVRSSEIGKTYAKTPYNLFRATNAILVVLIAVAQIIQVN